VLNCFGQGSTAGVIAGVDWVTGDHLTGQLAVANMSLGGPFSQANNDAVARSIADGVTYALAAGNSNGANACSGSPGSTPEAITVGATERNDARAFYSNIGPCVDIFAPGSGITSAWFSSDTATATHDGTSMASPHVAGTAALILSANPSFTPLQVRDRLVADATPNVVGNPGTGSPNRLLFVAPGTVPGNDFSVSVTPAAGAVNPGGSTSATVRTMTTAGNPQTVNFSATGLPAGASATFNPTSVTSGGNSTLTINTTAATPPGTYSVNVTGTGASGTRGATFQLTVNGTPGQCRATNATDYPIRDFTTVDSPITTSGCTGNASATSTVEVHIVHTYQGDLVVSLIAPDGTSYVLHNRTGGGTDNIDRTYTVNLQSEGRNGLWRLRVQDAAFVDTGFINSWTLTL
jgi:Subtilase family/Proprotein convertase P-domain